MRLFIAINLPEELYAHCKQMQEAFPELKKTADFHITLQFLGNAIEDIDEIVEALKKVEFESFEIQMEDATLFNNADDPRGAWIRVEHNHELKELAEHVQSAMKGLGYHPDKEFKAHITLGRYKHAPEELLEKAEGEPHKFTVDHFELMESQLTPGGAKYKSLARFPN